MAWGLLVHALWPWMHQIVAEAMGEYSESEKHVVPTDGGRSRPWANLTGMRNGSSTTFPIPCDKQVDDQAFPTALRQGRERTGEVR